jgi:hypothetical protein
MVEQLELISICLAESADSPLRADGQESKPSHSAKSSHTPSESCEKTSQEFGYSKTFGNFQQLNFASLSCLPEATRASLLAKPGSAEARKMTATSGLRCLELSEHQGRLGYSLKMLLDTLRWASTKCLLTWKAKNTPCNRLLFQLAPWTPRTDEIESGYWQTPSATLETQVARSLWATPRASSAMSAANIEKRAEDKFPNLETQVARSLLPTPTTQDASNNGGPSQYNRNSLPLNAIVGMLPTPTTPGKNQVGTIGECCGSKNPLRTPETMTLKGGALNPTWVEWLMGYPEGWTDCEDSETQSSRKSHTKSSKQ